MAARRLAAVEPDAGRWVIRSVWFTHGKTMPTSDGHLPQMVPNGADFAISRDGDVVQIVRRNTQSGKRQMVEVHIANVAIDYEWVNG